MCISFIPLHHGSIISKKTGANLSGAIRLCHLYEPDMDFLCESVGAYECVCVCVCINKCMNA